MRASRWCQRLRRSQRCHDRPVSPAVAVRDRRPQPRVSFDIDLTRPKTVSAIRTASADLRSRTDEDGVRSGGWSCSWRSTMPTLALRHVHQVDHRRAGVNYSPTCGVSPSYRIDHVAGGVNATNGAEQPVWDPGHRKVLSFDSRRSERGHHDAERSIVRISTRPATSKRCMRCRSARPAGLTWARTTSCSSAAIPSSTRRAAYGPAMPIATRTCEPLSGDPGRDNGRHHQVRAGVGVRGRSLVQLGRRQLLHRLLRQSYAPRYPGTAALDASKGAQPYCAGRRDPRRDRRVKPKTCYQLVPTFNVPAVTAPVLPAPRRDRAFSGRQCQKQSRLRAIAGEQCVWLSSELLDWMHRGVRTGTRTNQGS